MVQRSLFSFTALGTADDPAVAVLACSPECWIHFTGSGLPVKFQDGQGGAGAVLSRRGGGSVVTELVLMI
ncbi:hypothetical protein SAV14893_084150 [Streptomyces avermitilis]|uniref:Uncharacterized protein n=1 Tax=Streptomyces avermitilis TaxID=33903 RepID=A0A4D4MAU1_STRAX|nr:hypothetical protein SAVMC3_00820 [Streptomyces avermitilis]GDY69022.1 hypothetical protein SAV14893_084150 [Streptomyces avermitilis]GDY70596.1 hypothetical protein SAV31267_000810 [Streptomyces avermitilis]